MSITVPAHAAGSSPPPCMRYLGADAMADEQPPNNQAMRKPPIPPLSATAYTTKTSKQKKTKEEKQARKKELDRATLGGGAMEAGWSAVDGRVGTWELYSFKFSSPLSSQSYRLLL